MRCSVKAIPSMMNRRCLSSLPSTMRALVWNGPNEEMTLEKLKMPQPKFGEVLIKVKACGVCHTDLHVMKGDVPFPAPGVMGHEISGEVVKMGEGAVGVSEGDKVVSAFIMPCGNCFFCNRGEDDTCENFFAFNRLKGTLYDGETRLFRLDGQPVSMYSMGGLAEYCVVPQTDVFKLPSNVPFAESAILGCAVFTAYGAVKNAANLRGGESVCVIGCGGVGNSVLQVCKQFGATPIIGIDIDNDKLKKASELGATHTINAIEENVVEKIEEITGGRKVDVCIEALGHKPTFEQAVMTVRDGGKAVMVGISPVGVNAEVPITHIVRRRIQIIGSYGGRTRQDMPEILKLASYGHLQTKELITRTFTLDEAAQAYDMLEKGEIVGRAIIEF